MSSFEPVSDARPHDRPWPPLAWPLEPGVRLGGRVVELSLFEPERDAEVLFAALDHDSVWAHVAGRPADARSYGETLAVAASQGRFPWVVRLVAPLAGLAPGAVIGTSSYLDVSVPEAKLLLLGHAFDRLGAGRVQLKTDVRNERSQRAIDRLGARYEGTLRRYQRRFDDTVRDTVLFSILAEEWPEVRAGLKARLTAPAGSQ